MDVTIGFLAKKKKYVFLIGHQIISYLFSYFQNTQTSHDMSVCGNDAISPSECDTTKSPDIDTIPLTPSQDNSISDVSEP